MTTNKQFLSKKPMPVLLLDLKAQYATMRDEIREAIDKVVESQYFILGLKSKH